MGAASIKSIYRHVFRLILSKIKVITKTKAPNNHQRRINFPFYNATRYCLCTTTSIAVPLTRDVMYLLKERFNWNAAAPEDAVDMIAQYITWYGIVDDCHIHTANIKLCTATESKYSTFMGHLSVAQETLRIDEKRKPPRVENERNKAFYHYECTIYELLKDLRMEHNVLLAEQLKKSRNEITCCNIQ